MIGRSLVITPSLHGADGISAVARQVVRALRDSEQPEIWVLSDEERRDLTDGWASDTSWNAAGSRLRFGLRAARAGVSNWRGRLVVVLHVHLLPVAWPLLVRGARIVLYLHGIEVWRPLTTLQAMIAARISLLGNSRYTIDRFRDANPSLQTCLVTVCPPGISAAAGCIRAAASGQGPALIVGRLSSAERYKGHDVLLDIWPQVVARHPPAVLQVVGDGDDRNRLEEKAAALGLAGNVRFEGGVTRDTLLRLYSECTFFVMPSLHEGFGLVFLEAMQAGKACVAAPGAASEIVEHGVTGLVVDPLKPDDLIAAMVRLFREPDTCSRMGLAGAARLHQRFTESTFQQRFRAFLGGVTS